MKKLMPLERAIEFVGGQSALGRACGVHQTTVWFWLNEKNGQVPGPHVDAVVKACKNKVTAKQLRPDLYP